MALHNIYMVVFVASGSIAGSATVEPLLKGTPEVRTPPYPALHLYMYAGALQEPVALQYSFDPLSAQ